MTRWALEITWRDGGTEYLVDLRRADRRVKEFETPEAARTYRDNMLKRPAVAVNAQGIDVVPYPIDGTGKAARGVIHGDD